MIDIRDKIIADQAKVISELQAQILVLLQEIARLKHMLGLDSSNSGKPPSSDGLGKKNSIPKSQLKKKSNQKKGLKRSTILEQVENPNLIISHLPDVCKNCSTNLESVESDKYEKRQVFDLPEVQELIVSEHRLHRKICPCCSDKNYGSAPSYVNGYTQYGPNIGAICIYFYNVHMLPLKRITEIIESLYGVNISEKTILSYIKEYGEVSEAHQYILEENIRNSDVAHHDETGIRVVGKLHWFFTSCNSLWSKYWVAQKRGNVMSDLKNIMVRDCFKPYDSYNNEATMSLCNAHILRELEAFKDVSKWPTKVHSLLLLLCHVKNRYLKKDAEIPLNLQIIAIQRYDKIVLEYMNIVSKDPPKATTVEGKSYALLKRLLNRKDDILRFLQHKDVPFSNNLAERDLRMIKVKQKVSGCFRTFNGAKAFAMSRGIIKSLIKQETKILPSISETIKTGKITFSQLALASV